MKAHDWRVKGVHFLFLSIIGSPIFAQPLNIDGYVLEAGHPSLAEWLLPSVPEPDNNQTNAARVTLGEALFFDPALSGSGEISCASCHVENLGWSDGVAFGSGHNNSTLTRRTPTIINTGYTPLLMWDGRFSSLEEQALAPINSKAEMNMDLDRLDQVISAARHYKGQFDRAYPGEIVDRFTVAKALASFQRTIVCHHPPYFHDGSAENLEAVVDHYQMGGIGGQFRSPNMKPLAISVEQRDALIAFLRTLDGDDQDNKQLVYTQH